VELVLRAWTEADAPALTRAITTSLDHLRPWMPWAAHEPRDDAQRREWIRDLADRPDRFYGMWLGERVVGGCGLHNRLGAGALEIGYWVHIEFTRRGIATAAVRQLCAEAFTMSGIERVEIHHDRANVASAGVAAAAGFDCVREQPRAPEAPAQEGVELIWCLERGRYTAGAFRAGLADSVS
jgi:ribosomal-protein-serine acetyltransferase